LWTAANKICTPVYVTVISVLNVDPFNLNGVYMGQKNTDHNPTPSELNDFGEIVVPMEVRIPAKLYWLWRIDFWEQTFKVVNKLWAQVVS
jgi:hypothetical protein